MRLKLSFGITGKNQIFPLNYQYPVSAWIYKILAKADESFTKMLHDEGYRLENGKTFKLFTFSRINFPKKTWRIKPNSDRMEVWARNAWITISFQLPEQMEKFVMGLFKEQRVFIGDNISGIEMSVESIEALKLPLPDDFDGNKIKLRTLTPVVLGIRKKGKQYEQYENPMHPEYKGLFLKNLLEKYRATGKMDFSINDLDFAIIKLQTKTAMQRIKAGTPEETKVRGYFYEFELTAPKEIIEVGLNAGFGSMNSLGFGFCEIINR